MAGKRQIDDPRNSLFREYVRLLQGLKPKAFVMENVSGMVKGKMKLVFAEILRELKASGYQVKARLLNAMHYGVPQSRQRMIFIGFRNDLDLKPSHPQGQTKLITVGEAWGKIKDERGDALKGLALLVAPHIPPGQNNARGKFSIHIRGTISGYGLSRLSYSKPSCTLLKCSWLSSSPLVHPERNERISINQAKRIGSFPDAYKFDGKFDDIWARIGNSVPPLFMKAIAEHIKTSLKQ
jgi:DNA (cytosine-5)-methyltransferase 1